MRIPALLSAAFLLAVLAIAMTGPASALGTSLCKEKKDECLFDPGEAYPGGTTIEAVSANTVFKGDIVEECEASTMKATTAAEVANPLGGELTKLSFSECEPCDSAVVEKLPHATTLEASGEGKGTLTTAIQVALSECPFGINCVYGSKAVTLAATSEPVVLTASDEELPRKVGSETVCGSSEKWSGEYEVTAPKPMWVAKTTSGTALCKTALDKCQLKEISTYPAGTVVEAKSEAFLLLGNVNEKCTTATMKLTTSAESGKPLAAQVTGLSFSGCKPCAAVTAEALPSNASWEASSGGKGTLQASYQMKFSECPLGVTCAFQMTNVVLAAASEPPTITPNEAEAKRISGSEFFCGNVGKLDGQYKISSPEPFWIASGP